MFPGSTQSGEHRDDPERTTPLVICDQAESTLTLHIHVLDSRLFTVSHSSWNFPLIVTPPLIKPCTVQAFNLLVLLVWYHMSLDSFYSLCH